MWKRFKETAWDGKRFKHFSGQQEAEYLECAVVFGDGRWMSL